MPNWLTPIIQTLVTNAIFMGAITWLLQSLFQQLLSRDIEHFKSRLQATHEIEIERLRSDLRRVAFEHETRFSRLHEKRSDILAEFYKRLVETERIFELLVVRANSKQDPVSDEEAKAILRLATELWEFFEVNRIYFEPETCDRVFTIYQEFNGVWANAMFAQVEDGLTEQQKIEAWLRAWKNISDSIPQLRRKIEDDFRKLLGSVTADTKRQINPS